ARRNGAFGPTTDNMGRRGAGGREAIVWRVHELQIHDEPNARLYSTRVGGRRAGRSQYTPARAGPSEEDTNARSVRCRSGVRLHRGLIAAITSRAPRSLLPLSGPAGPCPVRRCARPAIRGSHGTARRGTARPS